MLINGLFYHLNFIIKIYTFLDNKKRHERSRTFLNISVYWSFVPQVVLNTSFFYITIEHISDDFGFLLGFGCSLGCCIKVIN